MLRRVLWHRLAEEDLNEVYLWLGAESPATAERLVEAVERAVALLFENPGAGHQRELDSPAARGVRFWPTEGFPAYLIAYRVSGRDLEIVRFLHGARDFPVLFGKG